MTLRDPDWLPNLPAPYDAQDAEPCSACDGEGEECETRGVWQCCGWCEGSGYEPAAEVNEHFGLEPGDEL